MRIISILKRGIKYILYGVPTVKQIRANVVALDINKMLEGKVALITGGTSGIGKSIAEAFLKSGATVIITGRNEKKIDSVLNNIKSQNVLYEHKAFGILLDNMQPSSFEQKIEEIVNKINAIISLSFCSVDIVKTIENGYLVMEINSGVMMNNFISQQKDGYCIAKNIYKKAILSMFE